MSQVIGAVSVKVIPDTGKFRSETKAELEAIEATLKELTVKFKGDYSEVVTDAKKAREAAKRAAKESVKIRFDIDDQDELIRAVKQIDKELDKLRDRVELKVDLDEESLNEAREAIMERLDNIRHLEIGYDPDSKNSLESAIARIDKELAKERIIEFSVRTNKRDLEAMRSQLMAQREAMLREEERIQAAALAREKAMKLQAQREEGAMRKAALERSNREFRAMIDRAVRGYDQMVENINFKMDVDQDEFARKVQNLFIKLEETKLKIKPELEDSEKFKIEREIAGIEAEIDVAVRDASLRTAQARLWWLGRNRLVTYTPVVDEVAAARVAAVLNGISGGRILTNTFKGFKDFLTDIDKSVPKIMTWTTLLTNAFSYIAAAVNNTTVALMDIGRIFPTVLALPGILGGIGIGIGSTIIAMKDWNKVFPTFKKNWENLKNGLSDRFWQYAAQPLREMGTVLLPILTRNLMRTGDALGAFFGNFATSLTKTFKTQLSSMFRDLNKSIRVFGKYTDAVAGVITKLGEVGAGNLPKLAEWFGRLMEDFDSWLADKGKEGIQRYVDEGIERLKNLGRVIRQTGRLFAALARAAEAAGGSSLETMADTLKRAADAANKANFQKNLTQALEGVHQGMNQVARQSGPSFRRFMEKLSGLMRDVLPKSGEALGTVFRGLFDAMSGAKFQGSVRSLFENIAQSAKNIEPAIDDLIEAFSLVLDVIGELGRVSTSVLAPVFSSLNAILQPVAKAIGAIPEPLRDMAMVLGIGVAALGAFSRAVMGAKTSLMAFYTQAQKSGTMLAGLNGKLSAAAGVAGVGGMIALQQGAEKSSAALTILGNVGTGAAMGAMIGSVFPGLGTAIGTASGAAVGLASGILSVKDAGNDAKPTLEELENRAETLRGTLDNLTGATTQATRALILHEAEKSGLLEKTRELGLTDRQTVKAITGEGEARQNLLRIMESEKATMDLRLNAARANLAELNKEKRAYESWGAKAPAHLQNRIDEQKALIESASARRDLVDSLRDEMGFVDGNVAKKQAEIRALIEYGETINRLPKEVVLDMEVQGLTANEEELAAFARKWSLSKREIKFLVKAVNTDATKEDIDAVIRKSKELDKVKPKMKGFTEGVSKAASDALASAKRGGKGVREGIEKEPAKAKAKLSNFNSSLNNGLVSAKMIGVNGGSSVGSGVGQGFVSGITSWLGRAIAAARKIVGDAISAMFERAKVNSPSKETIPLGMALAEGVQVGIEAASLSVVRTANNFASKVIAGLKTGFDDSFQAGLGIQFENINAQADKVIERSRKKVEQEEKKLQEIREKHSKAKAKANKKNATKEDKAEERRLRAKVKRQKKEVANAKKRDQALNNVTQKALRELDRLRGVYEQKIQEFQALKEEAKQYRDSVVESILNFGDLTGPKTFNGIVRKLSDAVNKTRRFADAIKKLTAAGLNEDSLKQLIAAGPEAGLAAAEAILSAGDAGVQEINNLMGEIRDAANNLGDTMVDTLYSEKLKELADAIAPIEQDLKNFTEQTLAHFAKQVSAKVPKATKEFKKLANQVERVAKGLEKTSKLTVTTASTSNKKTASSALPIQVTNQTINYYAASGSSLAEDDLFVALDRARVL